MMTDDTYRVGLPWAEGDVNQGARGAEESQHGRRSWLDHDCSWLEVQKPVIKCQELGCDTFPSVPL